MIGSLLTRDIKCEILLLLGRRGKLDWWDLGNRGGTVLETRTVYRDSEGKGLLPMELAVSIVPLALLS